MRKILVGTDTSGSADLAVRAAAGLAAASDAELLVLHVRASNGTHDAADPRKAPDPGGYLAKMSVPNLVLRHAPCSVLIVDTRAAQ
jgi:nucleotide-binding universal stress UspA family protein